MIALFCAACGAIELKKSFKDISVINRSKLYYKLSNYFQVEKREKISYLPSVGRILNSESLLSSMSVEEENRKEIIVHKPLACGKFGVLYDGNFLAVQHVSRNELLFEKRDKFDLDGSDLECHDFVEYVDQNNIAAGLSYLICHNLKENTIYIKYVRKKFIIRKGKVYQ